MTDPQRSLADYYRARALEYDDVYAKPERQSDLRAIERWLPAQLEDRSVLEVAAGTGYWTQFIARSAAQVTATDLSQETLSLARARVGSNKATFHVADAYRLPGSLGRFNAAFAGFWWSHVPNARRAEFLQHLHARLLPRARVVLLDNLYVEGSNLPITETDAEGNTYQTRTLRDGGVHRVLKNFPTEERLRVDFEGWGRNLHYRSWQYYWALSYETVD